MFSARGHAQLAGEDLGPWITSEELAALNLREVRPHCQCPAAPAMRALQPQPWGGQSLG